MDDEKLDWAFWTIEFAQWQQEQLHEKLALALWEQEWGVGGW